MLPAVSSFLFHATIFILNWPYALTFNADFRNGVTQLSWSPIRSGCLAAIGKESPFLKVWDIQESPRKDHPTSTIARSTTGRSTTSTGLMMHQASHAEGGVSMTPVEGSVEELVPPSEGATQRIDLSTISSGPDSAASGSAGGERNNTSAAQQSSGHDEDATIPILWKSRQCEPLASIPKRFFAILSLIRRNR